MRVEVCRVYDRPSQGARVLVDRLWPRGIAKADAPFDSWLKTVAPSTELRTWYGHRPERFDEFRRRYLRELEEEPARDALHELRRLGRRKSLVLVTATRDVDHSAAAVIRGVLTGS